MNELVFTMCDGKLSEIRLFESQSINDFYNHIHLFVKQNEKRQAEVSRKPVKSKRNG